MVVIKILDKIYSAIIQIIYPRYSGRIRYYLKQYYSSRLNQLFYYFKDFVKKKPYKEIHFSGEFAPELKFTIPFAYWHFNNGTLKSTNSSVDTSCFYFFSKNHSESYLERKWNDFQFDIDIPNSFDHGVKYDFSKWLPVPIKSHYLSRKISFKKPTLIISNKYNTEWDGPPINFLSIEILDNLFMMLKTKYQVIYNRPGMKFITRDNSEIMDLDEPRILSKHSEVILLSSMFEKSREKSFNEFQLRVYAGCEHFISVQGGNSVLASYFGGTNLIYALKGLEIEMNEYRTIFPKLSGAKIVHCMNRDSLIQSVQQYYL